MVFLRYINKVFLTQNTCGRDQANWIKLQVSEEDSFHVNAATFSAIWLAAFEQNKQNSHRDKQYNKVK